jgi:hypothetical protein
MPVGWKRLINVDESLRYSLNPLERVLCPFKKHEFNDFRRKCLNENGIIETLESDVADNNAISFRYSTYIENKYRLRVYIERTVYRK